MPSPFFQFIQKNALPGIWAQGILLARSGAVSQESSTVRDGALSHRIETYPEDEDWSCSCSKKNDLCKHVVAFVIALDQGLSQRKTSVSYELHFYGKQCVISRSPKELTTKDLSVTKEDLAVDALFHETCDDVQTFCRIFQGHSILYNGTMLSIGGIKEPQFVQEKCPIHGGIKIAYEKMPPGVCILQNVLWRVIRKPLSHTQRMIMQQCCYKDLHAFDASLFGFDVQKRQLHEELICEAVPEGYLGSFVWVDEQGTITSSTRYIWSEEEALLAARRAEKKGIPISGITLQYAELQYEDGALMLNGSPYKQALFDDDVFASGKYLVRIPTGVNAEFLLRDKEPRARARAAFIINEGRVHTKAPQALQPLLPQFESILRTYQHAGASWLAERKALGIGALLADDMGLGKTIQALTQLESGALIVCPRSVTEIWQEHIAKFLPGMPVTIVSYQKCRLDIEIFEKTSWSCIVFDEIHMLKNPNSQTTQAMQRLQSRWRLGLTGTPIENRLADLASIMQVLEPGLGDQQVRPLILRRIKSEVLQELPPRIDQVLRCELSEEESALYNSILVHPDIPILERLLRLRQACCHPALVGSALPSSKLACLIECLQEESEHHILIFSQFTSFLDLIGEALKKASFEFDRIDGSTKDRGTITQRFQAKTDPRILLLSLKAAGIGLTLTAADRVYILDPWWNPTAEDQAQDRAHRMGQTSTVIVTKIIAAKSLEEKILELQAAKRILARSLDEPSLPEDAIAFLLSGGCMQKSD